MVSLPILTIVGGTGIQGQSVLNSALKTGKYRIRVTTRNPDSQVAKSLAERGVEVVKADLNDVNSLITAFEGTTYLYTSTNFYEPFAIFDAKTAIETESTQGINSAKAAAQCSTLEHYIWSTMPSASKISGGKWPVPHFDAKNRVDDYIKTEKSLWNKTTFLWIPWYASNYVYPMFMPSLLKTSGTYIQLSPAPSSLKISTIGNPITNIGPFALSILEQPELSLPGKCVFAAYSEITMGGLLETFSKVTGKPSKYIQISSIEDFDALWPKWGEEIAVMLKFWETAGDKAWKVEGNEKLLTKSDLGLDGYEGFEGVEAACRAINWDALL